MLKIPKALKEIHKIQEQIYREEKGLTGKQIIEKTRQEVEAIKKKYNLRSKSKASV
jgi:prophage maintenance system killer protein